MYLVAGETDGDNLINGQLKVSVFVVFRHCRKIQVYSLIPAAHTGSSM